GLDAEKHYSTARDLAKLMCACMENKAFCKLSGIVSTEIHGTAYLNHNKLLTRYPGCIGGKTGYTGSAGRTLVTCAERDGLRLVAVTLHDGSDWADHTALYEYGFENYHSRMPVRRGEVLAECAVRGGESVSVPLAAERAFSCAVAEGEKLTLHIEAPETAEAPVTAGQRLGEVTILLGDTELGRVGLTARHGVSAAPLSEKTTFLDKLRALFGA
ncbi:MAG: D-alanyl-D-alanine carboxypeptidase, partial [Oscillospiraceae bacterium]|nr:D-alanyl-D-alanine carboxypeptidase [Oscillospiraceae bacterium]